MKKIFLITILSAFYQFASAQGLILNVYSAYVFDDHFDSSYDPYNYYRGKVKGGYQWGGGLEYSITSQGGIELLYLRQDTHAPTDYQGGLGLNAEHDNFEIDFNYIMISGESRIANASGSVEGFGSLMAGVAIIDLSSAISDNQRVTTKFAWGAKLGVNIWVSDAVGIMLHGQLTSPVQGAGGGFYFGTGGTGAGLTTYSTLYQFGLGGGLAFKLQGGPTAKKGKAN